MERKANMPVPIGATVSRKTGKIRFKYSDDYMDQVRYGQTLNRIARIQNAFADASAKAEYTGGGAALRVGHARGSGSIPDARLQPENG